MSVLEQRRIFAVEFKYGRWPVLHIMANDPVEAINLAITHWNTPDEEEERYEARNLTPANVKSVVEMQHIYVPIGAIFTATVT